MWLRSSRWQLLHRPVGRSEVIHLGDPGPEAFSQATLRQVVTPRDQGGWHRFQHFSPSIPQRSGSASGSPEPANSPPPRPFCLGCIVNDGCWRNTHSGNNLLRDGEWHEKSSYVQLVPAFLSPADHFVKKTQIFGVRFTIPHYFFLKKRIDIHPFPNATLAINEPPNTTTRP